tara:strand:- start:514 stop:1311 length:798 start_codon:yes stop_codon:yes gene_type:complete
MEIKSLINLKNQNCLVTGGFGYLGKQIIEAFAELGANIITLDLKDAEDDNFKNQIINKYEVNFEFYPVDLSSKDYILKACDLIKSKYQTLKCIVNNAGILTHSFEKGWNCEFEQQNTDLWNKVFEINITAPFILSQELSSLLSFSKGSIINISSIYGIVGPTQSIYEKTELFNPCGYAVSKAGLIQMTKWLAAILAPKIRVNAIVLGGVERSQSELFIKEYSKNTLLNRMAKSEEIKGAIVFLGTDLSTYTTGSSIFIDGGWTAI